MYTTAMWSCCLVTLKRICLIYLLWIIECIWSGKLNMLLLRGIKPSRIPKGKAMLSSIIRPLKEHIRSRFSITSRTNKSTHRRRRSGQGGQPPPCLEVIRANLKISGKPENEYLFLFVKDQTNPYYTINPM